MCVCIYIYIIIYIYCVCVIFTIEFSSIIPENHLKRKGRTGRQNRTEMNRSEVHTRAYQVAKCSQATPGEAEFFSLISINMALWQRQVVRSAAAWRHFR